MKKNYNIILLFVISTFLLGCKRENPIDISEITERTWTSVVVNNNCVDSLNFQQDKKVTYYSCEIGWNYEGIYELFGDTIEISINMAQLEVDNYDQNNPTSKYFLKYSENELEWLKIEHLSGNQFEEVEPEIYKQINNWKK